MILNCVKVWFLNFSVLLWTLCIGNLRVVCKGTQWFLLLHRKCVTKSAGKTFCPPLLLCSALILSSGGGFLSELIKLGSLCSQGSLEHWALGFYCVCCLEEEGRTFWWNSSFTLPGSDSFFDQILLHNKVTPDHNETHYDTLTHTGDGQHK